MSFETPNLQKESSEHIKKTDIENLKLVNEILFCLKNNCDNLSDEKLQEEKQKINEIKKNILERSPELKEN